MEHTSGQLSVVRTCDTWGAPLRRGPVERPTNTARLSAVGGHPRSAAATADADAKVIAGWAWRTWTDQPEIMLLFAVLHDAVGIVRRGPARNGRLFAETRDWFLSDDILWPTSFLNICDALDLEPDRLRARLAQYLEPRRDRTSVCERAHARHAAGGQLRLVP